MTRLLVSGIPGSGKTTLARALAPRLHRPVLDKDDFLDALFDERGTGDDAWRTALSREADARFVEAARATPDAILVSWWRHPRSTRASGTPVDRIVASHGAIVELHCQCDPTVAVARFLARTRHPGHRDAERERTSLAADLAEQAALGPLGLDPRLVVDVTGPVDVAALAARVRPLLAEA